MSAASSEAGKLRSFSIVTFKLLSDLYEFKYDYLVSKIKWKVSQHPKVAKLKGSTWNENVSLTDWRTVNVKWVYESSSDATSFSIIHIMRKIPIF